MTDTAKGAVQTLQVRPCCFPGIELAGVAGVWAVETHAIEALCMRPVTHLRAHSAALWAASSAN